MHGKQAGRWEEHDSTLLNPERKLAVHMSCRRGTAVNTTRIKRIVRVDTTGNPVKENMLLRKSFSLESRSRYREHDVILQGEGVATKCNGRKTDVFLSKPLSVNYNLITARLHTCCAMSTVGCS